MKTCCNCKCGWQRPDIIGCYIYRFDPDRPEWKVKFPWTAIPSDQEDKDHD